MIVGIGAAILFGIVALFHLDGMSPHPARWVAIALFSFYGAVLLSRAKRLEFSIPDVCAISFIGWAALTLLWAPDLGNGLLVLQNILLLGAAYFLFSRIKLDWLIPIVLVCMVGALVLGFVRPISGGGFGNQNWIVEWLLLACPFAVCFSVMYRNRTWGFTGAAIAIAAVVYSIWFNESFTWVPILCSVVILALVVNKKYWVAVALIASGASVVALFPDLLGVDAMSSLTSRLEIFTNTVFLWLESPVWGHGAGSFDYGYSRVQEAHIAVFPWLDTIMRPTTVYAGAAHNEALQILTEYGIIGLLIAVAMYCNLMTVKPKTSLGKASVWVVAIGGTISMMAFPLQNPATGFLIAAALGIWSRDAARRGFNIPRLSMAPPAMALSLALLTGTVLWSMAHRDFGWVRPAMDINKPLALQKNWDAYKRYPIDPMFRRQLALTLIGLESMGDQVRVDDLAAEKIFAVAVSASPHNSALLMAILEHYIVQEKWQGKEVRIESILTELKTTSRLQPGTWVSESVWAAILGDEERMMTAVKNGLELDHAPPSDLAPLMEMAIALQMETIE
tara:strand:+ start:6610 stop:8298 length:1689 start_codon:yes stop_codon:yes gene_type:complete